MTLSKKDGDWTDANILGTSLSLSFGHEFYAHGGLGAVRGRPFHLVGAVLWCLTCLVLRCACERGPSSVKELAVFRRRRKGATLCE